MWWPFGRKDSGRKQQPSQQWVVVYSTPSLPEAHIVAGRLQSEDIPAMVYKEAGTSALGINLGVFGEACVVVHPENHEAALALLEEDELTELPAGDEDIIYLQNDTDDEDDQA